MNTTYPPGLRWLLVLMAVLPVFSQTTTINLGTQGHNADFSSFPFTKPVSTGTVMPAGCTVGQLFFNTAAPAGSNLYGCTATNVWSLQGGSSTPSSAPAVSLNSSSLTFASTLDGSPSAPQTITVSNSGTGALTVSNVSLTGTNAADFSQTNTCNLVAAQGTCSISVIFTPSIAGAEHASLSIADDASSSPQTVALSGTGQALNGGLTVTTSASTATINGAVTLTANRAVNFSLVPGAIGTLATVDSTHATYTAPASIPVQGSNGGCMTEPNDSILETPITAAAVDANSATMLSQVGNYGISPEPAYWVNIITDPNQQLFTEKYYYGGPSTSQPYFTGMFARENGQFTNNGNYDHHTISVLVNNNGVTGSCRWYEAYQEIVPESAGITRTCYDNTSGCTAISGMTYSPLSYTDYQYGTNVAGITTNLIANLAEIKNNTIHHPMTFTMGNGFISSAYRWPATYSADFGGGNTIPVGARLRLQSSFVTTSYSQYAQNILNAWKNYGIILLDGGDEAAPTFNTDVYEDPAIASAISEAAANVKLSNFEVVNTDALKISNSSLEVNPLNTAGVTPVGFAYVSATDAAPVNGTQYTVGTGIALQGVLIGVPQPQLNVLATSTSYTYQLPFWVTGTTNQAVTWTLTSGPGSVTTGGVYTVPAASSLSAPTAVVLTGTAAADANATVKQYLELIPFSSDGNFRMVMDSSSHTDTSSPTSFTWWQESGMQTAFLLNSGHDYPSWSNVLGPEANIRQYSAQATDGGGDLHLKFVLPNGNYKTRLLYGFECRNYCGSSSTFAAGWRSPEFININGQMDSANYQWGEMVGYAIQTAWDYYAPAQVTNGLLDFWTGGIVPNGSSASNPGWELSGIEIMPDTSSPHIAIDTGVESWNYTTAANTTKPLTVTGGATAQLGAVGWYMSNSVAWAVTSGGGSVNATGLYTAPAATLNPQTITITATSTVDNTKTATATLTIPGSGTAALSLSPTSLTFGSTFDGAVSAAQAITVNDTGTSSFNLSRITFTGTNAADFAQTNNCTSVAAGSSCTINVTFTPSIVGAESATLTISGTGGTGATVTQTAALSGTGAQGVANASLTPTLTFPSTPDGNLSSPLTLTLSDNGTASGGIVSPTVTITGTNAADFTESNACTAVSPGASCSISVVFNPSIVGAETATLTVTFSNGNSPLTATLNGTGTASTAGISLSPASLTFPATSGMSNFYTTNHSLVIQNTGTSNLIIRGITLTGTSARYFWQINNCTSIAPGASCGVGITFFPPSDTNTSTAALSIADNATGSPHTVALSGTDGYGAQFGLTPNNVNFASTAVGTTTTSASISLSNTSTSVFTIGPLTVVGANASDFTIGTSNCGTSIAASSSCNFTVNFKPTIVGVETAAVSFTNSSGYASPATLSLVGIGH